MQEYKSEDEQFALAIITRQLHNLPPLLTEVTATGIVACLRCSISATQPRTSLLLRCLRKTLSLAIHENDTAIPLVSPLLHQLAAQLPLDSRAGNVAAGLLLLFAHGLGALTPPTLPSSLRSIKPLVVILGFAGGTPKDMKKYANRIYNPDRYEVMVVTASEIPQIYNANVASVIQAIKYKTQWTVHLFSKAGFLLLGRLMHALVVQTSSVHAAINTTTNDAASAANNKYNKYNKYTKYNRARQDKDNTVVRMNVPAAVVWDSSPGSVSNYNEFITGTWQSAELIAKRGGFEYDEQVRRRMDVILNSKQYPLSVRDSYAPMHHLIPFPVKGIKHLFLFSEKDNVCAPEDIRKYSRSSVGLSKNVVVKGIHCDGLFWSGPMYCGAVEELMNSLDLD